MVDRLGWALCTLVLLLGAAIANAAAPESGVYWVPGRPAQAYTIEHQQGRVVVLFQSYDASGRAEWFSASGQLIDGPIISTVGHTYRDTSHITAPILNLSGGPALGFPGRLPFNPVPSISLSSVGTLSAEFGADASVSVEVNVQGQVVTDVLSRFNFGIGGVGRDQLLSWVTCWPDFSGDWVFVDRVRTDSAPSRYRFLAPTVHSWNALTLAPEPELRCGQGDQIQDLTFVDTLGGAVLRCSQTTPNSPQVGVPDRGYGCELSSGGFVRFSFATSHAQLTRVRATRGALNGQEYVDAFTSEDGPTIYGYRIE